MIAGLCLAAAIAAMNPIGTPPADAITPAAPADQGEIVSDAELAEQRGGFRIGTLDIRLGADIRSYVGGRLVMQTSLSWTDIATSVQHVFPADASSTVASDLTGGLLTGSGLKLRMGDEAVVFVNQGQTAFVQRTDGTIQNILVNTASSVDLRQQIDARLDIGGFAPFANDLFATRIGSALASMGTLALIARRTD